MFRDTKGYSGFAVDDLEKARGQDEIVRAEGLPTGAWFTDPAGNIILVHEPFSS